MRKLLIVGAAVAVLATPALAADLARPVYKAPPAPPPPALSWTGFYIGLNGGYGWNDATGRSTCVTPGGVFFGAGCDAGAGNIVKPAGGLFGGQIGYNMQSGPIVYGLESDIQWSDIRDSVSAADPCCSPAFASATGTYTASSKLDWFGTVRGRVGFAAGSSALLYATGGLIYGHEAVSDSLVFPAVTYASAASTTRAGWTVGGGLEYLFTPAVSGKIEGLWYDMGSLSTAFTSPLTGFTEGGTFNFRGAIIRAGLNYHFNLGGPVATRY